VFDATEKCEQGDPSEGENEQNQLEDEVLGVSMLHYLKHVYVIDDE
jgi:hypothetical protein